VILKNEKPEHEASKPTLRRSSVRPTSPQKALTRSTVASALFKSRVLNRVHLNQAGKYTNNGDEFYDKEEDAEEEEKVSLNGEKSAAKHQKQKKTRCEAQYVYQYNGACRRPTSKHYSHKRGSEPPQLSMSTVKCIRSPDAEPPHSAHDLLCTQKIKPKVSSPFTETRNQS
jgi:hypothetical protein